VADIVPDIGRPTHRGQRRLIDESPVETPACHQELQLVAVEAVSAGHL
jgi:hypothetical protein